MKKTVLFFATAAWLFTSCELAPPAPGLGGEISGFKSKKYPAHVALQWISLQQHLIKTTPGFDPLVASRSFAYSGLTLYESIVKGMPGYNSIASPKIGIDINAYSRPQAIYWPASANAAAASVLKNLFANTSAANKNKIDSLEAVFNLQFQSEAPAEIINQSGNYGRNIANHIFEWSKTDSGHEAYLGAINSNYIPPTGPGLWIPTPAGFSQPIRPYWGNNRSFVPNSAALTLPGPPPAYSENEGSEFYQWNNDIYNKVISLTPEEISIVKTWGDMPGNYGTPAHYTNVATQLIQSSGLALDEAAFAYAKHGIALYEATICVFKAKYTYNLIRPVSFIRNILGHSDWNSLIGTPPHPEYPSAHSVLGGASYIVLESFFGENYFFIDKTHENLWGARSYDNLKAYAIEAAESRVLGGLHYEFSAKTGLEQGEKVGHLVNNLKFRNNTVESSGISTGNP
jgi:hypothetical protein